MNKIKYTVLIFNEYCPQKCELHAGGPFWRYVCMQAAFDIYLHFLKTFLVAKHYSDQGPDQQKMKILVFNIQYNFQILKNFKMAEKI
jgi:uncharacterized protein YhhL (DUF1145 family)